MATLRIHGVVTHAGHLEYATLEPRVDRPTVAQRDAAACPRPTGARDLIAPDAGPVLHQLSPALAGECSFALPARRILIRIVELPSTDPDELEGMVELQVDQFSPFPVEQLVVSYEALEAGLGTTRTLIAAARRDQVEEVGRLFREAGLRARWLDLDVLGWWWLIRDQGAVPEIGREVMLLIEPSDTLLIVVQDGAPLLFRSLDPRDGKPPEGFVEMVIEEVDYALTSIETEWGSDPPLTAFTIWHRDEPPPGLGDRIHAAFDAPPAYRPLDELPALSDGIALRAGNRVPTMLDLAPVEWETAARTRLAQRRLIIATGALILVWLLGIAGVWIAMGNRRAQLAALSAELTALEEPAAEVRAMREQSQFLERYTDQTSSALEHLRAVSTVLPAGVDLNSLSYSKGGAVNLRGTADSRSPIFEFLRSLQDLDLYSDVKLGKVDLDRRSGKSVFRLTATLAEVQP